MRGESHDHLWLPVEADNEGQNSYRTARPCEDLVPDLKSRVPEVRR